MRNTKTNLHQRFDDTFLFSTTHNGGQPPRGGGGQKSETQRAHISEACDHVSQERDEGFHKQHVACTHSRAPARSTALHMLKVCAQMPIGATARPAHAPLLQRRRYPIHPAWMDRGSLQQRANSRRPAQQPAVPALVESCNARRRAHTNHSTSARRPRRSSHPARLICPNRTACGDSATPTPSARAAPPSAPPSS